MINPKQVFDEFVDREQEMDEFEEFLRDDERSLLAVYGQGGVGKSWLLAKMQHLVAVASLRKAEIVWTDNRGHDYLAVMRKIRDDLDAKAFNRFTSLINEFTVPNYKVELNFTGGGNVSLFDHASLHGVQAGTVAGVVIKDLNLINPRTDMEIPEQERITRLTDIFVECLRAIAEDSQVIVFLDAVEKVDRTTGVWLWESLLPEARDGRLGRVKFVLLGRVKPELDRAWRSAAVEIELHALQQSYVKVYLRKRGIEEGVDQLADMLIIASGGNMLALATWVDTYLERCS